MRLSTSQCFLCFQTGDVFELFFLLAPLVVLSSRPPSHVPFLAPFSNVQFTMSESRTISIESPEALQSFFAFCSLMYEYNVYQSKWFVCHGVLFWFPMCSFVLPFCCAGCLPSRCSNDSQTMRVKSSFQVVRVHRGSVWQIFCFQRGLLALFWSSPSFSAHLPCMETERSPWLVWCWLWMGLWQCGRWSSGWRRQAAQCKHPHHAGPNPQRVNLHKACQMFRGFLQIISWKQVSRI